MDLALQRLTRAESLLSKIVSAPDALKVSRLAEAARVYARQMQLGLSSINHAMTIKLLAERRLAEVVDNGQKNGQIARRGGDRKSKSAPGTLKDLGVDHRRVAEARELRKLPEPEIRKMATTATEAGVEMSRKSILRVVRKSNPSLKERAASHPSVRWLSAVTRVRSMIIGIGEAGGPQNVVSGWNEQERLYFTRSISELIQELSQWLSALEKT